MRHIYKGLALCAALVAGSTGVYAQEAETDSLDKVQVAFRAVDKQDLMGGVSVIDMKEMTKKNYATSSIEYIENERYGFFPEAKL